MKKKISVSVVPLRYGLNIRKDINKICRGIIAVYTRERMWAFGSKLLGVPVIYEKRQGFSATDIKKNL